MWQNEKLMHKLVRETLECINSYAKDLPVIVGADLNVDYDDAIDTLYSSMGYQDLLFFERMSGSFFTNVPGIHEDEDDFRVLDLDYLLFREGSSRVTGMPCVQPSFRWSITTDVLPNDKHPSDHLDIWASFEIEHSSDPKTTSVALEVVTARLLETKTPRTITRRNRVSKKRFLLF